MSDAADARAGTGSSPYATGGGGTVLEHRFGAILLAHLLTGDPVPGLGDDCDPREVVFQASSFSAVDDLVIRGRGRDGMTRMLSIGVRRAPSLVPSDAASVHLFGTFLQVVADQWDAVRQGRWRLQLAAAALNPDVRQLHELAAIAHGSADESRFRAAVAQPSRTTRAVRDRLVQIDHLVAAASETSAGDVSPSELTWRLLSVLSTRGLRLEGADLSDRTECVARLRSMTSEGTAAVADSLFATLAELSGRYAPTGASVTEGSVRRDLAGHLDLARSTRHAQARRILETLSGRLRQRTGSHLGSPDAGLELERAAVRQALVEALGPVSPDGRALVITGDPDVGKSALVIKGVTCWQSRRASRC